MLRTTTQSPVRIQTSSGVGTPIMAVTVQQSQGQATSAVVTTQQQLQQLQLQLQQQAAQQSGQPSSSSDMVRKHSLLNEFTQIIQ